MDIGLDQLHTGEYQQIFTVTFAVARQDAHGVSFLAQPLCQVPPHEARAPQNTNFVKCHDSSRMIPASIAQAYERWGRMGRICSRPSIWAINRDGIRGRNDMAGHSAGRKCGIP
ncbi:hypothetical protein GGI1_06140, partial [Acidithiobacillus sp. GGI-221]